jgi:hypothetical protein
MGLVAVQAFDSAGTILEKVADKFNGLADVERFGRGLILRLQVVREVYPFSIVARFVVYLRHSVLVYAQINIGMLAACGYCQAQKALAVGAVYFAYFVLHGVESLKDGKRVN